MNTKFITFTGFLLSLITICPIYAGEYAEKWTPQSQELLRSLQNDVRETLSLIEKEESRQGHTLEQFQYSLDLPETHKVDLGLILEMNDNHSALVVISATPGGLALSHGLKVNDVIVSVDGIQVSARNENAILERLRRPKIGESITLMVKSQDKNREIVIPVSGRFIPQIKLEIGPESTKQSLPTSIEKLDSEACGEVSVLIPPSGGEGLYPAAFNMIDEHHDAEDQSSIKLPVGRHTIYVYERIDDDRFTGQIERKKTAKAIQINVTADTSFHLAAKFVAENDTEIPNSGYWEAVIWKTTRQECRL